MLHVPSMMFCVNELGNTFSAAYGFGAPLRDENSSIKYTQEVETLGKENPLFDNVKPHSCFEATEGFLSALQMLDHRAQKAFQG